MTRSIALLAALALFACGAPPSDSPDEPGAIPDADAGADAAPESRLDPVAALVDVPGACSVDRWCWRQPRPRGARIQTAYATAHDNLWLAGEAGYVLQWDGARWREHVLPPPPHRASMNLGLVAGRGPDDMWIGGGDLLYHWDGAAWTLRDFIPPGVDQAYHGIWVAPNGDVWVTMDYGVVKRSIGGAPLAAFDVAPAQSPLSELGSVWGTAANDVWIAGRPGRMFHWDGSAFTEFSTGTYKSGGDLRGASATDAWIGGYDGTLVHWDGAAWRPVDTGLGTGWYIKGIGVVAANDVRWIAQRGSHETKILMWDGSVLTSEPLFTDVVLTDLEIVDGRWWIPGDRGALYVRQPGAAAIEPAIEPVLAPFRALWGTTDRDLYAVGPGLIARYDGGTWTKAPLGQLYAVNGVGGSADSGEVWAVGASPDAAQIWGGVAYHFDGAAWQQARIDATHALNAVWAGAPGEALAVGDGGVVYQRAAGRWTRLDSPVTADLYGVWGPDRDRAWIVGANGAILRWERGAPLAVEASGVDVDLRAIHGADDVRWIATTGLGPDDQVGVLQSSPTGWVRHPVPNLLDGLSIFATSADDVMVVGANNAGRVFRWTGAGFVEESTGHTGAYSAVFRPRSGSAWIAGASALLQRIP